ncbi:MAG: GAF domain-containing protein [Desulfotomaculum sp.]|nr:GAF domain-containing protein [Desulfotomaculum sp.]
MLEEKRALIENLTGVNSSKLNYYLELKKRNEEIIKQNNRLEIIHQIVKDINIDMSIKDIINRAYSKLPSVLPCDLLGLSLLENGILRTAAVVPHQECIYEKLPANSLLWDCIKERKDKLYTFPNNRRNLKEICHYAQFNNDKIRSLVTLPLFVRGKVIGTLVIGTEKINVYTESELKFCRQLADQLAICIENARLYEEVLRGKREWEETFAAVIDPIYLIDLSFNVIRSNNRDLPFSSNLCVQRDSGCKCYQVIWGRKNKCSHCLLEEVVKTGEAAKRRVQASGHVLDVYYYPVFNNKNKIYAVIHHIQDVTEKIKMEAQLVQSAKLAAIGEMAAGVAHELNSPMTVIIGTAQMMLKEMEKDHPRAEFLKDVINSGLRCKRIIQNLLTFSRQEQQPMGPTDVNDMVQKVLSLTRYQINRSKITIKTELSENLPLINANGQQVQQVLINLLLNARDALESVERDKIIKISTGLGQDEQGKHYVWLTVEDNGEGIEEDKIDKIFNPFYTSKEASKGTGLGLSVSLGIAQAHGGTIEVKSNPGEGSIFKLILPVSTS